ncbi:sensor domain-containing diguanylate cyclase [Acidiferrimicrobium sp. IK]|uniref:sensor domain-containing diguanylate cyclase n=1 Tax=Acidiferrimicrobium sp. IK TaxID=2871700 RepID=UPI0021CB2263|nr:sensor domain-containing diguanylate cyclase [Acidiferrimicrobium sp. IK]MCU4184748.1 sensor domain-containing diguanylate cyclase [Acidiferrimicrobium sp. IK]
MRTTDAGVQQPPPSRQTSPARSRLDALKEWLIDHPTGIVGAVGDDGKVLPFPPSIVLGKGHRIEDRSLLELVVADDTVDVTYAFLASGTHGVGSARARLLDRPDEHVTVTYLDLRDELGVTVRTVSFGSEGPTASLRRRQPSQLRPRLATMTKSSNGIVVDVDRNAERMLGWTAAEVVGRSSLDLIHPEDQARSIDNWMQMMLNGGGQSVRLRYQRSDGTWLWLETSNDPRPDDGTARVVCHLVDVSDEVAAMEALRRQERLLRRVTDTVPVGLVHFAADGSVSYANDQMLRLVGLPDITRLEQLCAALPDCDGRRLDGSVRSVLSTGQDGVLEVTIPRGPLGPPLRCRVDLSAVVDAGEVLGVLVCVVDVTDLKAQAAYDGLTGLLNRASVLESLKDHLRQPGQRVGVVFVDLDDFKLVNDQLGHAAGDVVLEQVAAALMGAIRSADSVGRLGGDEFLVVCPAISSVSDLACVVDRMSDGLSALTVEGWDHPVTASLGVALVTGGETTVADAVAAADRAMYDAKGGRHTPVALSAAPADASQAAGRP